MAWHVHPETTMPIKTSQELHDLRQSLRREKSSCVHREQHSIRFPQSGRNWIASTVERRPTYFVRSLTNYLEPVNLFDGRVRGIGGR
jgi:hypothetical protein